MRRREDFPVDLSCKRIWVEEDDVKRTLDGTRSSDQNINWLSLENANRFSRFWTRINLICLSRNRLRLIHDIFDDQNPPPSFSDDSFASKTESLIAPELPWQTKPDTLYTSARTRFGVPVEGRFSDFQTQITNTVDAVINNQTATQLQKQLARCNAKGRMAKRIRFSEKAQKLKLALVQESQTSGRPSSWKTTAMVTGISDGSDVLPAALTVKVPGLDTDFVLPFWVLGESEDLVPEVFGQSEFLLDLPKAFEVTKETIVVARTLDAAGAEEDLEQMEEVEKPTVHIFWEETSRGNNFRTSVSIMEQVDIVIHPRKEPGDRPQDEFVVLLARPRWGQLVDGLLRSQSARGAQSSGSRSRSPSSSGRSVDVDVETESSASLTSPEQSPEEEESAGPMQYQ